MGQGQCLAAHDPHGHWRLPHHGRSRAHEGWRESRSFIFFLQVAEKMATQWLAVTYQSFIRTHSMFEKYNVSSTDETAAGSGGEYEVQVRKSWEVRDWIFLDGLRLDERCDPGLAGQVWTQDDLRRPVFFSYAKSKFMEPASLTSSSSLGTSLSRKQFEMGCTESRFFRQETSRWNRMFVMRFRLFIKRI